MMDAPPTKWREWSAKIAAVALAALILFGLAINLPPERMREWPGRAPAAARPSTPTLNR